MENNEDKTQELQATARHTHQPQSAPLYMNTSPRRLAKTSHNTKHKDAQNKNKQYPRVPAWQIHAQCKTKCSSGYTEIGGRAAAQSRRNRKGESERGSERTEIEERSVNTVQQNSDNAPRNRAAAPRMHRPWCIPSVLRSCCLGQARRAQIRLIFELNASSTSRDLFSLSQPVCVPAAPRRDATQSTTSRRPHSLNSLGLPSARPKTHA